MKRRRFCKALGSSLFLPRSAFGASDEALAAPELYDPTKGIEDAWTIAVLPDTQNYAKFGKNQAHFVRMCQWLADNRETWRIKLVLHEGDLVEQNNIAEGGGRGYGDQNSQSQWESAKRALSILDGKVPTILTTGNHDYGIRNSETRETRFNEFFPTTSNPLISDGKGGGILIECGENSFGKRTLENAAYEYIAPDGTKMLIVALEWGPRKAAVDWARELMNREIYRSHTGLLLTHNFITPKSLRDGQDGNRKRGGNPHVYPTGKSGDTHDGEDLWQSLVKSTPNCRLVLNGHEMGSHVGRRSDLNEANKTVHQMLFNAQGLGGGSDIGGNGGDGWLRLLSFGASSKQLSVRTFSPLKLDAGKSPWWDHPQWNFTLKL